MCRTILLSWLGAEDEEVCMHWKGFGGFFSCGPCVEGAACSCFCARRAQVSSGASRRARFDGDVRGIRRWVGSGCRRGHPARGRHSVGWPRAGIGSGRYSVSGQIRTFPQAVDFGVSLSASFTREFDREGRGFDGGSREGAGRQAGPEAGCRGVAGTSRRFRSSRGHQGGVLPSSWHQSGVVIVLARQVWDGGLCQDRGAGFGAWLGCRA